MNRENFLYPLIFKPVFQNYIWGAQHILQRYTAKIDSAAMNTRNSVIAESWEISDRSEGMSIVDNGRLKNTSLHNLLETYGEKLVGKNKKYKEFPLLIKIIDAAKKLSVQVHPSEQNAAITGGEPKTEMWYVLDALPGSLVYAGLKHPVDKAEFLEAVKSKSVEKLLNPVPVKKGDVIFIPGGRIHCISEGCLLLEIQQNSNTTYRIYDWDRTGNDNKPRKLHLKEALETINFKDTFDAKQHYSNKKNNCEKLLHCDYFLTDKITINTHWSEFSTKQLSFHILFAENYPVQIKFKNQILNIKAGFTTLIPACIGEYSIKSNAAGADIIRIALC
jgi:mannose-6-phosphate isomerase